jgi:hypothetical protein
MKSNEIINITIHCVVDSLVELGLLHPLSGDTGYNGVTTIEGVSNELLTEKIEDNIFEAMEEYVSHSMEKEFSGGSS